MYILRWAGSGTPSPSPTGTLFRHILVAGVDKKIQEKLMRICKQTVSCEKQSETTLPFFSCEDWISENSSLESFRWLIINHSEISDSLECKKANLLFWHPLIFAFFEILSKGLNYFWVPFHTAEKCLDRIRTRERKRERVKSAWWKCVHNHMTSQSRNQVVKRQVNNVNRCWNPKLV